MKIKDILFQYIQDKNGLVDFNEISQTLLEKVPTSKWGISHWNYYKSNITSQNGRYYSDFSNEIKDNLKKKRVSNDSSNRQSSEKKNLNVEKIIFPDKSNDVEKELAILLGRVSHHIHPKIID